MQLSPLQRAIDAPEPRSCRPFGAPSRMWESTWKCWRSTSSNPAMIVLSRCISAPHTEWSLPPSLVPSLGGYAPESICASFVAAIPLGSLVGVGVCGRSLCCSTFLPEPSSVPNRLVSEQGMASNPLAVTGACGKLMCCLRYESPYYADFEAALGEVRVPDAPRCPLMPTCSRRRDQEHKDA